LIVCRPSLNAEPTGLRSNRFHEHFLDHCRWIHRYFFLNKKVFEEGNSLYL
jgi:hypothetical protein